jgi:glycosyltransferase involved in cell wall biosynthesis
MSFKVNRMRVVHIINSFEFGGAEAMLCNLLLRSDRNRFDLQVVSLIDDLSVAGPIIEAGIPLVTMGMKPGVPSPAGVFRLIRHLRKLRPDVIQTWMDHSNLIGGIAGRFVPGAKVVWGIHHSNHVPGLTKRSTLMTVRACGMLSGVVPAKIVCCSETSRAMYSASGFACRKIRVIPNGFDTGRFQPDSQARLAIRAELGLNADAILIGLVARYDPLKDHATFLRAAGLLQEKWPNVHFLLCGNKVDADNPALTEQIAALNLSGACHLLGPRRDVPRIFAALDIATSSSISEAFPLAIGEAMSCGIPCVATDVGDSALMIGPSGKIVPPSDPAALAAGWAELLQMDAAARAQIGAASRERVRERFDLDAVTWQYQSLYEELAESNADCADNKGVYPASRPIAPAGGVSA